MLIPVCGALDGGDIPGSICDDVRKNFKIFNKKNKKLQLLFSASGNKLIAIVGPELAR